MRKIFLILIGAGLLLATLFFILLPSLLSTPYGNQWILEQANSRIPGRIYFKKGQFSLFGPQKIRNGDLFDQEGKKISSVDVVVLRKSFYSLLFSRNTLPSFAVTNLAAKITSEGDSWNLYKALGISKTGVFYEKPQEISLFEVQAEITPDSNYLSGRTLFNGKKGEFFLEKSQQLSVELKSFPTPLIALFTNSQYGPLLGDLLNLSLEEEESFVKLTADSSTLQVNLEGVVENTFVRIPEKNTIRWTLAPEQINPLLKGLIKQSSLNLTKPVTATATVSQVEIPYSFFLKRKKPVNPVRASFNADINIDKTELRFSKEDSPVVLENGYLSVRTAKEDSELKFDLSAKGVDKDLITFHLNGSMEMPSHSISFIDAAKRYSTVTAKTENVGRIVGVLSDLPVSGAGDGELTLNFSNGFFIAQSETYKLLFKEVSEPVQFSNIKAVGRFNKWGELVLTEPLKAQALLTPTLLNDLLPTKKTTIPLLEPSLLQFTIEQPVNNRLKGKIETDKLIFAGGQRLQPATLRQVEIPLKLTIPTKEVNLDFHAKSYLSASNQFGTIAGSCLLNHPFNRFEGKLFAQNMPSDFFKVFSDDTFFGDLMGETVDINLLAELQGKGLFTGDVNLSVTGDQISAQAAVRLGEKGITLQDERYPAWVKMEVTPARFALLQKNITAANKKVSLSRSAKLEGQVRCLNLPRNLDEGLAVWNSAIDMELILKDCAVEDLERSKVYQFPYSRAALQAKHLGEKVNFNLEVNEKSGKMQFNGTVTNGLTNQGYFNRDQLTLDIAADANNLPISVFARLIRITPKMDKQVEAVLGEAIDGKVKVQIHQLSGPVFAEIKGENGDLLLDGTVKKGNLLLNQPLTVHMNVTEELGKSVFKDVLPLFSTVTSSDHPITLEISPDGFTLPVHTMNITELEVGKGALKLGKIYFQNSGPIASVLTILNDPDTAVLTLWCTPCYFSVKKGIVKIERMDMLISETYPVALWGKVDLPRRKVNMKIGLSAQALTQAFPITGLSDDLMITLPLKGTLGKASINKTKAITKLASLAVKKNGDAKGVLLGTMLDIATGNIMDGSIPPPTTSPLPWEQSSSK